MVTIDVHSEKGDNLIWGLLHVQISSHLAKMGTVMEQSQTHHGILSLPWRILKPGNLSRGKRKYDATTLQPDEFTANTLQRWAKDIVPISQGCNLLFIECIMLSDGNWAADITSGTRKPACTGNNGSSQPSAIHVSTHPAVINGLPNPSPSPVNSLSQPVATTISNPAHSFPLPPSVQSASAIEYLAQPAPINIPAHSSHILASQPVPSSPSQTAGSAQVLINASIDSPTQSIPPAQSTAHVHAPVLPHAHTSSQLPLADQPGTQSQLDLLAYAAILLATCLYPQRTIQTLNGSNLSGANVDAIANGLFSALHDHILGKEPEREVIDVDAVDDPFTSEFLTIHGLLMVDTHFRVGRGLGNGVECAVYDDLFATKLLTSSYWVQVNSYWSISLPPIFSLNSTPLTEIETWGALMAIYILHFGLLPPSVSPLSGLLSMEPRQIMEPRHHIVEGGHNMHLAFALHLAQVLLLRDDQFQSNAHPHYLAFKHGFNIKFSEGLYMCQQCFNGSIKILICQMANLELNNLQDWIDSLMWPSDINFEAIKKVPPFYLLMYNGLPDIYEGHPTHHALASHVKADIWCCDAGDVLLHAQSFHRMVVGSSLILTDPMWAISFRFSDCIPNSSGPEPKLILPLVVHSCTSEVEVILTKPMVNMLLERPDDRHPGESYFFDAWMHLQFALADSGEFSAF
ncbi:hypothetical protein K439DRAFT_1622688 [Ramaria rubella]|nr:hypothetical protein K439DRAFT_1622688 [Ramaria rubella]